MIAVTTAHLSKADANMLGEINISKVGSIITLEGVEYKYLATGLCREVYYSADTHYVIKVPKQAEWACNMDSFEYPGNKPHSVSVDHNIAEAQMYAECPQHLKDRLPETTLLDNGWVKQSFVKAIKLSSKSKEHEITTLLALGLRECGIYGKGGTFFDFCFMMRGFKKPATGWDWEKLENYLNAVEHIY